MEPGLTNLYFARTFHVEDPSAITALQLHSRFNKGIRIFINGELVAKVKRRGDKAKWPGDSYEIIIRWPTDVEVLPYALSNAILKMDADDFVRKLCAENDDIYVIEENFNERVSEAYYNLWCRPSKRG